MLLLQLASAIAPRLAGFFLTIAVSRNNVTSEPSPRSNSLASWRSRRCGTARTAAPSLLDRDPGMWNGHQLREDRYLRHCDRVFGAEELQESWDGVDQLDDMMDDGDSRKPF